MKPTPKKVKPEQIEKENKESSERLKLTIESALKENANITLNRINEINLSIEDLYAKVKTLEELRPQLETTITTVTRIVKRMGLGTI